MATYSKDTGTHEAIISDEVFISAQEEKHQRSKTPKHALAMKKDNYRTS